jgi:hypothetical protein
VVRLVGGIDEEEDKVDVGVESDFFVRIGGSAFQDRVLNDVWGVAFKVSCEEESVFVSVGRR